MAWDTFWYAVSATATAAAALVIWWYALETRRLRKLTERQLEAAVAPLLILRMGKHGAEGQIHLDFTENTRSPADFTIYNYGKGTALKGSFCGLELPPIPDGKSATIRIYASAIVGEATAEKGTAFWPEVRHELTYESVSGCRYRTRVLSNADRMIERTVSYEQVEGM